LNVKNRIAVPRELPGARNISQLAEKFGLPRRPPSDTTEVTPPEFEHCHLQSSIARALSQATRPLPVSWEGISGTMTRADSRRNYHPADETRIDPITPLG
jgi:hypothetical protein